MNQIVIPAILATVLVAGMSLAIMPIDKASTVHQTILAAQIKTFTCNDLELVGTDAEANLDNIDITVSGPILLYAIYTDDAGDLASDNVGFEVISIDGKVSSFGPATFGPTAENIDDDPEVEILAQIVGNAGIYMAPFPLAISSSLKLEINDAGVGLVDDGDTIDLILAFSGSGNISSCQVTEDDTNDISY